MTERDNERIPGDPARSEPVTGAPIRDPLADDPNRPHRNPNMIHPAPRSANVDHRPGTTSSRSSSTWVWILVGGIALIAIFSFFTVGTDRGDVTTTGTVPQQSAPATTAPGTPTTDPAMAPPPAMDPAAPVQPATPQ